MKLSADTPPDGDFVRYLAELERDSPSYQTLKASVLDANIGAVPKATRLAERLRQRERPSGQVTIQPLPRVPSVPSVASLVAPLLRRLEQALAAAAQKNRN